MPRSIRDKFPASVSARRAASVRLIFLLMRACRSLLMPYSLRELQRLSRIWLNMDSSQFAKLGHQEFQQGSEQAFTSEADVVHELKKTQVERQFLLRDAPMGPQPRAEQ